MKLSVIIPVYNDEKYIERCIDSITNQRFEDFECILVDDGSKDKSYEILKRYAQKDKRLKVYHTDNLGVSNARNVGLNNAHGEYITFIDGDDYIEGEYFQDIFNSKNYEQWDIYCCGIQRVDENNRRTHIVFYESDIESMFLKYPAYMYSVCNKVFRKELIQEESFKVGITVCEDMIFSFKAFTKATKVKYLDDDYYCYYKNNSSASYKKTTKKTLSEYKGVYRELEKYLIGADLIKSYGNFLKYRKMYYYIFFLTDVDYYDPHKYRTENIEKLIWHYNRRIDLLIISLFARIKIDLPSKIYVNLKRTKNRVRWVNGH